MELRQFHSSPRVRTCYFKALAKLSERLNETWKQIFPPDAAWPRQTCEAFFEPFAEFGVALYDAYAQELLDSTPSHEHYLQVLNFDLKTLLCDQIYPYRERSISTLQDALDADARGELPGEWTVRMGEAWRLFEHPRHNAAQNRVCREFIDVYGYRPDLWEQLIGRISKAMSRRSVHWLAAHAEAFETLQASHIGLESSGAASEQTAAAAAASPLKPALGNRKRGRPQIISDEKKTKAAKLKASGGTNKEAASVIYGTKYPSAQQAKNVSAILKHHEQKSKQSGSPVKSRKASPKHPKTKG